MRFGQQLLFCTPTSSMARLVLVSIPLILQMISVEARNNKLNPPYPLSVKGHHQSFRRGASIQYDRMCNATGYGK